MSNTKRKNLVGKVVSSNMDKTAVISLEWRQRHPLYGKQVRRITKAYAHDERNECKTGDLVAITETRPLSKTKRWRVVEILNRQALSVQEVLQNEGAEDTSEAIDEE
jgi:small subunit ribosomal protein S17